MSNPSTAIGVHVGQGTGRNYDSGRTLERRSVLVMGGLARLANAYRNSHPEHYVVVANTDSPLTARRLESFDAIVLIPTNLSHQAARRVLDGIRRKSRAVFLAPSPGVTTVRRTIDVALRSAA